MLSRRGLLAGTAALAWAQSPKRRLRIGIIEFDGHVDEILAHVRRPPPDFDLTVTAIAARDPEVLRARAANPHLREAQTYTDYRELLARAPLDLVAVCNDNGHRAEAVLACLERKLPTIAEKPLALTKEDLARVRAAHEQHSVPLGLLLPLRYDPPYLALREIVRTGQIGDVLQIDAQKSYKAGDRPRWMRERATYGGTLAWIGIHMIDLMHWTSGRDFARVTAWQRHIGFPQIGEMENVSGALYELDNGGIATLRMDYLRPETAPSHGDDRLRLAGSKGVAEYQAATGVTLVTTGSKPTVVTTLPPAGSVFLDFLRAAFGDAPASLSLKDIWRVNEVTLGTQRSADTGAPVKL